MKMQVRAVAFVLFVASTILTPAVLFAQSPFDGSWRTDMAKSTVSPKPNVFTLSGGMYDCSSCSPTISVKADGQGQPVMGQEYDTISVREIDPKSIEIKTMKNGKPVFEQTRTVSDDGSTLMVKTTYHPPAGDAAVTSEVTGTRVGEAPAGAHASSGSWQISKISQSENGLVTTYKSNGDELTMSTPNGEGYTAKLDGNDYPVTGEYFYNTVSLKRVDDRTIDETDKRDGQVVDTSTITISADGNTMTVVETNPMTGRTSTWVAEKM
jgi:hypothetical protein